MEKIVFTNSQGLSVELGNEGPFILTKIEGTGAVTAAIQTQKSPFQDGMTYIDNTLEPRPLSIEIMVIAENEEEMTRRRRKLLQTFNPKLGPGRLIYEFGGNNRKEIEAISELAPAFPNARPFEDTMQSALITLYCPSPFWVDEYKYSKEISAWIGGMKFPWVLPSSFAMRSPSKVNIVNDGDVETPVKIEFKGPATNPRITNLTTNEYIQVNRKLDTGETLIINTEFGNKRVEIEGKNVFNWIDINSVFWQLKVGDNIVEYSSDDPIEPASVLIIYKNRYIGI